MLSDLYIAKSKLIKMSSILLSFILIADIFFPIPLIAASAQMHKPRVVVNGCVNGISGYLVDGEYYFKPQDIAKVLSKTGKKFSLSYDSVKKTLIMAPGKEYKNINNVIPANAKINLDGKAISIKAYSDKNTGYFKMRDIARTLNFSFKHDKILDAVYIWTDFIYFDEGEEDVARAIYDGFVPATLQKDRNKQITYKEFASMLSLMIAKVDIKLVPTWKKVAALALKSDKKMQRQDGMLALLYAAEIIGCDKYNSLDIQFNDDMMWNGFKWKYPEFPNWNKKKKLTLESGGFSDTHENYMYAAMHFSVRRISSYSGKPLFEYDKKTLRAETSLTRRDAMQAVARLFDSRGITSSEKMVPINNTGTYDKKIITDSLLQKAQNIPEPTLKKLPYYTGFCLQDKSGYWGSKDAHWKEKDVQMVAEWGFNYLRVKADSLFFFNNDITKADENQLEELDNLVSWGLKYGVHIDFQIGDFPGWRMIGSETPSGGIQWDADLDFYTNKLHQQQTRNMWAVLAKRYKGIPNNVLTFSINHETHNLTRSTNAKPASFTENDVYNATMGVVNAVRGIDKNRLMFFETAYLSDVDAAKPTVYMKDAGVVQTFKYSEFDFAMAFFGGQDVLLSSGYIDTSWPKTFYNACPRIVGNDLWGFKDLPLVMDGALKKDTKIDIFINGIAYSGTITVTADGQKIYEEQINPKLGQDNCVEQTSNWSHYEQGKKSVSFTLKNDIKELKVSFSGPDANWLDWGEIHVTLPEKYAVNRAWYSGMEGGGQNRVTRVDKSSLVIIRPNGDLPDNMPPRITINENCTYSTNDVAYEMGKSLLLKAFSNWVKVAGDNKIVGMCNELGVDNTVYHKDAVAYLDDMLSALKQYNLGWVNYQLYTEAGVFDTKRFDVKYQPYNGHLLDVEMLKVLQKYQ